MGDNGHDKRPPRSHLTLRYLKSIRACSAAQREFEELFGQKATIAEVVKALHRKRYGNWEAWLLAWTAKDIVEAMLIAGARVNANFGFALLKAAERREKPRARLLLDYGARISRSGLMEDELRWVLKIRAQI